MAPSRTTHPPHHNGATQNATKQNREHEEQSQNVRKRSPSDFRGGRVRRWELSRHDSARQHHEDNHVF